MKNKFYILIYISLFFFGCTKDLDLVLPKQNNSDIFLSQNIEVENGIELFFNLDTEGNYYIKLIDIETNNTISRDRFYGKVGKNTINIYTKTIQTQYLYLILENGSNEEIKKTKIVNKL